MMRFWTAFFTAALTTCMVITATAPAVARPVLHDEPTFTVVSDLPDAEREKRQRDQQAEARRALAELNRTAQQAAEVAEVVEDAPAYDEPAYDYQAPAYDYAPSDGLTRESGVNYHDGRTETWYSSNVLYHHDTPSWTLDDEGFYRDAEGRYVVAASDKAQGEVFEGSKGECVVLDTGCAAGVTDYYVGW